MYKYIFTASFFLITISFSFSSYAFDLMQVLNTNTVVIDGGSGSDNNEENYSVITAPEDISDIIAPLGVVQGYIPFNKRVGFLNFSVLSPKKTKMYLEWDNLKALYPRRGVEIKFRRSGESKTIAFNTTKRASGYIYLYNSKDRLTRKLLAKVKYIVKKQRSYSQTVRSSLGKQPDSRDIDTSLSYSINKRAGINDPLWSAGFRVENDKSTNLSFAYTW